MRIKSLIIASVLTQALLLTEPARADDAFHFFHAPHHLSMLSATTYMSSEGSSETIGIDYEYRISELTGLGFVLEHAFAELDATTVLAVADIHLGKGWVMQLGPGYETTDQHDFFVTRVGFIYEFVLDGYTFSPQLHWDYHHGGENAIVAGFAVGFGF